MNCRFAKDLAILIIFYIINKLPCAFGKGCPEVNSQHEWTVSLLNSGHQVHCGGVLISPRHILTAEHCLANARKVEFINSEILKGTHFSVLRKFRPPESLNKLYATEDTFSRQIDIGILEIRQINDVTPIGLPQTTGEALWGPRE